MSPCTNCKKLTTHHVTFDALSGVNIIKPGERLCNECYNERRWGIKPKQEVKQLQLF